MSPWSAVTGAAAVLGFGWLLLALGRATGSRVPTRAETGAVMLLAWSCLGAGILGVIATSVMVHHGAPLTEFLAPLVLISVAALAKLLQTHLRALPPLR